MSIPAETDVTVQLPNEGVTPHNFSIDELGISVDIAPGASEETVINAPAGSTSTTATCRDTSKRGWSAP